LRFSAFVFQLYMREKERKRKR